ncbi:MAG: hypothetical protein JOY54_05465 [Acidobacteriaceae bacterium]|nr:hypothetical protein [Acidobacteriaceae bacterium]
MRNTVLTLLVSIVLAAQLAAAAFGETTANKPAEPDDNDVFHNLHFRNLGPAAAGGRVTAVTGVPGDPNIYYVGAAAGGVYKTDNGGITWKAIFEHEVTASIGSIALALSNPNFVWVGTGEANIRNDVMDGAGVYFSSDAGESWKFMGLRDAGQISRVLVDPKNPENVFVGALGHAWGPNSERGVFRTSDGGKTWKKVLYVDDVTGVADLAMQPGNPEVLYAAMWHVRRYPWTLEDGGETSGLYRTTDGGETWKKLTEGLPKGPLGRMAIAVAPSNPNHLYALVTTKDGAVLYQSTDMGNHWNEVSNNHALDVRPFYFSRLAVSPVDEDRLYFLSFQLMESDDGGKTAHVADHGVHPDHHAIWIDPHDSDRMIQGNDGGAFLTTNDGKSWRFLDSLPIEQFYQIATDSETPYHLCGGLQDNSAWCGPSTNQARSGITNADWFAVLGGDGEYSVPAPSNPDIIYSDAQNGYIERLDKKTHLSHFVRPYLPSVEGASPADLKYRFNWTSPIAVSATDPNEVYLGANVVFKTMDGGKTWNAISGDLTRNDKSKQVIAGGPVNHDISGAETYGTILALALAPTDPNVIWVGTDDGCVQVTRNGGKQWTRVDIDISGAPQWARVYQIGVSPFEAGTAFVAFDAHELDDRHAYVYKTSDYGRTWQKITDGLPDSPVFVVRADPNQRGFLVLGNDQGIWYSADAGGHWKQLKANFPTAPVFDLKFVKESRDLVVATHGRGAFIFDNLRPIEEMTATAQASDFHLFSASDGFEMLHWDGDEGNPVAYSAPNAPRGATVDYLLKAKLEPSDEQKQRHETPVKITVTDREGHLIATHYGPSNAGVNRFVWDLRYSGIRRLESTISPEPPEPGEPEESRFFTTGPRVLPGEYTIEVSVNGQTQKTTTRVYADPNLHLSAEDLRAQMEAALTLRREVAALNEMIERIDGMQHQIADFKKDASRDPAMRDQYAPLLQQANALDDRLKAAKAAVLNPNVQHEVTEDDIHALTDLHSHIEGLAGEMADAFDQRPTPMFREEMEKYGKQLDEQLAAFNRLLKTDVAAYNKAAYGAGAPTVFAGTPITTGQVVGVQGK